MCVCRRYSFRASRGINGETVSEKVHVDTKDLPASLKSSSSEGEKTASHSPALPTAMPDNLPGPVQEAQEAIADLMDPTEPFMDSPAERTSVTPTGERASPIEPVLEHEDEHALAGDNVRLEMSRATTSDSVQIVGDIVA